MSLLALIRYCGLRNGLFCWMKHWDGRFHDRYADRNPFGGW
jgi:hypothetical protein